jgi:hypothetical protein
MSLNSGIAFQKHDFDHPHSRVRFSLRYSLGSAARLATLRRSAPPRAVVVSPAFAGLRRRDNRQVPSPSAGYVGWESTCLQGMQFLNKVHHDRKDPYAAVHA